VERAAATEYLRDQYTTPDTLDIAFEAQRRNSERPVAFFEWVRPYRAHTHGDRSAKTSCTAVMSWLRIGTRA